MADIVSPKPTSCAVLDDGDIDGDGDEELLVAWRSDVQYFTRWTALSKLLKQERLASHPTLDHSTHLMYDEYIFMKAACL